MWLVSDLRHLDGGDDGIRTHDPLLAGQVLSQLSYTPINNGCSFFTVFCSIKEAVSASFIDVSTELSSRAVSRKVF